MRQHPIIAIHCDELNLNILGYAVLIPTGLSRSHPIMWMHLSQETSGVLRFIGRKVPYRSTH